MLKRTFATLLPAFLCASMAFCQQTSLSEVKQLPLPADAARPVLSPDGGTLLFSTQNGTTLRSYDMDNGVTVTLDEAMAAGIDPIFTSDSKRVIYRTAEMKDKLMYRDVREAYLPTGKITVTEGMSRKMISAKALPEREKYAVAGYDCIYLSDNGKIKELRPLEDAYSYIKAALSPDGRHILFTEPFKGLFICDADGSNPRNIAAKVTDATWADNSSVLIVVSHDDGYVVLTSALIYIDINTGKYETLTDPDIMPESVTVSPADGQVVFSTVTGEIFNAKLNINHE